MNFRITQDQPSALARLPALAERLGVKPIGPDHPPTLTLSVGSGQPAYDVFDLINALLDLMEKCG